MDKAFYTPTLFSRIQASLQAALCPGIWWSTAAAQHSHRQRWVLPQVAPKEAQALLNRATATLGRDLRLCKSKESEGALQVFSFTKVEWLDVLDFSVTPNEAGGSMIEAHSWSSGMVPCSVPGAPALNALLFFVPFLDHGLNKMRLMRYRARLASATTVEDVSDDTHSKSQ